jgi:large subunit ribosomal protein L35
MPKLKSKSGAKKRFRLTASGKVKRAFAGKRHGMIKRTPKQIREHRGMTVAFASDAKRIRRRYLPGS